MLVSLRARLQPPALETVAEMEAAAQARYEEGQELIRSGFFDGGIYLLGYVAEMLLKTAICRIDPFAVPTTLVTVGLRPARSAWMQIFPGDKWDGHNLLFLSLSLENERRVKTLARLHLGTERTFNYWVNLLYDHWFVSIRYRHREATQTEAIDVISGVEWLRNNYNSLWTP